jgi:hypothetical protein
VFAHDAVVVISYAGFAFRVLAHVVCFLRVAARFVDGSHQLAAGGFVFAVAEVGFVGFYGLEVVLQCYFGGVSGLL